MFHLDTASNYPGKKLSEYSTDCSDAVSLALDTWNVSRVTDNATVRHGYVNDNKSLSMLWTTTFQRGAGSSSSSVNLEDQLRDLFHSQNLKKHALMWDNTFHDCHLLDTFNSDDDELFQPPLLVHWQFNAAPLASREMVKKNGFCILFLFRHPTVHIHLFLIWKRRKENDLTHLTSVFVQSSPLLFPGIRCCHNTRAPIKKRTSILDKENNICLRISKR